HVERRPVPLSKSGVLREELDGAVAGPVDADLTVGDDAEAVLEADLRAGIDAEEVVEHVAEFVIQRTREPVRHAERAAEPRQPQRSRQANQGEVGHRELQRRRIIGRRLRPGGGRSQYQQARKKYKYASHVSSLSEHQ